MTEIEIKFVANDIVDTYLFKNKMDRKKNEQLKTEGYAFLETLIGEFPEVEDIIRAAYGEELTKLKCGFEPYTTEELERMEYVDNVLNPQLSSLNKR